MAGARIELDFDGRSAATALAAAAKELAPEGQALLLADIGEYLLRSTRDRAAKQTSPDGTPWAALSPRYAKVKGKIRPGVPILRLDNHMLGDQLVSQVEGDTLYHGTNAPYGAIQQFGGDIKHPERPTKLYFHHAKGEVSPHFVNRKKANFVQDATIGEHTSTMPARPWLGLSKEDEAEIIQLVTDHLAAPFDSGAA